MPDHLTILKFGGSVLRGRDDLAMGVAEVRRWRAHGPVIAVVSAFEGTTDGLLAQARELESPASASHADPAALALLLATGEFTTAALLTMALASAGVRSRVLGPQALGLKSSGGGADADPARADVDLVRRTLDQAGVVVAPGFIAMDPANHFALLGRGGSDLTALFLAAELAAHRCRLIKDVDGVYDADPNAPGGSARRYERLRWEDALELDGGIVQHKAVRLARKRNISFEVGAWGRPDVTTIGAHASRLYLQPATAYC